MRVSVVIPVYNVEEYVADCLRSVLDQTWQDMEVLIADDGSTDLSGSICDTFASQDPRIRVIHKANGGLSDARNCCIREATGEFIAPVDSDDRIEPEYLRTLVGVCLRHQADAAVCAEREIGENDIRTAASAGEEAFVLARDPSEEESSRKAGEMLQVETPEIVMTSSECLTGLYHPEHKGMTFSAWGKIYRRSLFTEHRIEYPVGRLHEDTFTTYRLIYYAKTVVYVPRELYLYRRRSGSIMTRRFDVRRLDAGDATREQCEFFLARREPELAALAVNNHMRTMISLLACMRDAAGDADEDRADAGSGGDACGRAAQRRLLHEMQSDGDRFLPQVKLPPARKALYRLAARFPAGPLVRRLRMF